MIPQGSILNSIGKNGGTNLNALQMSMDMSKQAMDISKQAAESLFSNQLASALSTISDSQFFQDSISPSTIRSQFASSDPSNPSSTPTLINSMKWLLASMSKGRDVSDFFPHVVKLVGCHNLELRKMVYMYLVHYADHNATCRDLALLSINAFQRGLSDSEQWIRALALRVLTSIRVNDVIQIQIMAVEACTKDPSPYVRKCASTALAKLYPRLSKEQQQLMGNSNYDRENQDRLVGILKEMLAEENSTMVLTSVMCSFVEICPDNLEILHGSYRKLCHLLTDMDEWGQIIVMDVLSGYCRMYFKKPTYGAGENGTEVFGTAEKIDRQRRVVRRLSNNGRISLGAAKLEEKEISLKTEEKSSDSNMNGIGSSSSSIKAKAKSKQKKVKKGFYSDEEDDDDDSSDNEHLIPHAAILASKGQSVASSMRQRNVLGLGSGSSGMDSSNIRPHGVIGGLTDPNGANEDDGKLDEDHRLLLRSSLPLLKSRNSGVVLGVCSLHYYCGVASIKIRSALGKALVRIYHDRREIQFIVLNSIRMLVWECPSAFTPFLHDFFVKAMDPSFTRLVKLDILCALALEPNSIQSVLNELRTYICHDDKKFVCASVQAVGKIVEMARIVFDRIGEKRGNVDGMREEANVIALNCLHGILTLMESNSHTEVIAECIEVTQRIFVLLQSNETDSGIKTVSDPSQVQFMSLRRLVLFVVATLIGDQLNGLEENEGSADEVALKNQMVILPTASIAPALWIIGETFSSDKQMKSYVHLFGGSGDEKKLILSELLRLLAKHFTEMEAPLKCHCVHFTSKIILSNDDIRLGNSRERIFCEYILALGRVDTNQDVRDRSRNESLIIHLSVGINYDVDTMPKFAGMANKMSLDNAKSMLLEAKPSSSWLPIENEKFYSGNDGNSTNSPFRLGTLSSMVSHRAGTNYIPLPPWAKQNSPKSLRDPPKPKVEKVEITQKTGEKATTNKVKNSFYGSDSDSDDSTDSDSDSDSGDDSSSESESSSDSSSSSESEDSSSSGESDHNSVSDESTSSEESDSNMMALDTSTQMHTVSAAPIINPVKSIADSSDDESSGGSSEDESSEEEASEDEIAGSKRQNMDTNTSLIDVNYNISNETTSNKIASNGTNVKAQGTNKESEDHIASGLEGLVMAPLKIKKEANQTMCDIEEDSSNWSTLVRHDLSGGLSVQARFLRRSTKKRELLLLGLDPNNAAVLCVQLKFENKRDDNRLIRRIRLMQRTMSGASVPISRVIIPQEIDVLDTSQISYAIVGVEFVHTSDKEGAFHIRFDVKCDRSTTPVDIRPPLAEQLYGNDTDGMTKSDFNEAIKKLQGIHQRAVTKFDLSQNKSDFSSDYDKLPTMIMKAANLNIVEGKSWSGKFCRFIGSLPASGLNVFVELKCDKKTGVGELAVCCDNAMAVTTLMGFLKQVIN